MKQSEVKTRILQSQLSIPEKQELLLLAESVRPVQIVKLHSKIKPDEASQLVIYWQNRALKAEAELERHKETYYCVDRDPARNGDSKKTTDIYQNF